MKLLMITGGLLGFLIGTALGLAQNSPWPDIIWKASVVAYVAGLLMRWWGRVWIRELQNAALARQTALYNAKGAGQPNPPKA
ncbi:MAG TPA: hypothetical protein P5186_08525 [Candidatus Paceibacterota bacterium]|nr:hypothetical protein [Verrucomicrobiota bacterium]HRY48077.1 hypothetical protein [Candidatus Paceibacterota bacterium]HSA00995.1 hypothetical protein [Candidatus Paceibacterota bacterium]